MQELNQKTFEEKTQSGEGAAILFYSPTCAHCKRTEAGIEELEVEGVQTFFGKVDITAEPELASRWDIQVLPTLLFFRDGAVKDKKTGFTHKLIINEAVKKLSE
ncbi:MAG TPA: thioredoxin family protein [Candidatus Blautia stercoravium]|nr:thioredoxin family protein [Candidatus Blautia stercoravium]